MEPAPYPNTDTPENLAIQIVEQLLELNRVKSEIKRRDKVPNSDGHVELVDPNGRPLGKLELQVRKIDDDATSARCGTDLIAYSQRITSPFLFVGVDVKNRKAYWRHISFPMVELKEGKQSCTIHFDPLSDSIGAGFPYFERWLLLARDYQNRISTYPRLRQRLADTVRLTDVPEQDRIWFQTYIDSLNRLLDDEFPTVKSLFFSDTWKLGVAITSTTPELVSYSIYKVTKGESAPLLISAPGEFGHLFSERDNGIETGGIPISANSFRRSMGGSPEAQAKDQFSWYVSELFSKRALKMRGELICVESIFQFLDEFNHALGVELKDEYEIAELRRGFYAYFPHWYIATFQRFCEVYAEHLKSWPFPTFSMIARTLIRIPKAEVESKVTAGTPFNSFLIPDDERHLRSLIEALDFLFRKGVERIHRPYKWRSPGGTWIWSGFSAAALRQNFTTVFGNLEAQYREFVEGNGFHLSQLAHCTSKVARIYVANLETLPASQGLPFIEDYVVENGSAELPSVQFIDASQSPAPTVDESRQYLLMNGERLKLVSWGASADLPLFGKSPLLNICYRWLAEDLSSALNHHFRVHDI